MYLDMHGLVFKTSICYRKDQSDNVFVTKRPPRSTYIRQGHLLAAPPFSTLVIASKASLLHARKMYIDRDRSGTSLAFDCSLVKAFPHTSPARPLLYRVLNRTLL